MNSVLRYFDLASDERARRGEVKGRGRGRNERPGSGDGLHWFPQYVAMVLGVVVQPFFAAYQQTSRWSFGGFSGRLLFAIIVGLVIFPAVYKRAFDPEKPLFVQLCAIFAAGMGWESLLRTALKATGA